MKIFGRYPAAWLSAIVAVLAVVTNVPGSPLTPDMAAWVVTVASALIAVAESVMVRPVTVPMLTGVVRTLVVAVGLFGFEVSAELSGAIVGAITMIFGLLVHANGTPTADPAPGFIAPSAEETHTSRTDLRGM